MALGDWCFEIESSTWRRRATKVVGILDLHSHYRLRPLLHYLARNRCGGQLRVLEVGCGIGMNLFELYKTGVSVIGLGVDTDVRAVALARHIAKSRGVSGSLRFEQQSAERLGESEQRYDLVLAIDVLEHLKDPREVVSQLVERVEPGGEILVSVPTMRYPRVVGKEFHLQVGHLRDGYTLHDLRELFSARCEVRHVEYSTGLIASGLCRLFYQVIPKLPWSRLRTALAVMLVGMPVLDILNGPRRSCSLFVAFGAPDLH